MSEEQKTKKTEAAEQEPEMQPAEEKEQQAPEREAPAEEKETKKEKKKTAQLEERIQTLEAEATQKDERYLRVLAEYDNFRKRSQKERSSVYQDAQIAVFEVILPVLDNLERAAAAETADEGVRMILRQFQDILKKCGVEECGREGEPFDPNFHNAVLHAEGEGSGETVIAQVLQKGYTMNGKLIRPAMVKTTDSCGA